MSTARGAFVFFVPSCRVAAHCYNRTMRMRSWVVALTVGGLLACGDDVSSSVDAGPDAGSGAQVVIGTPSEDGRLGFVPLEVGGDIPLDTFGQGGTHATLAVRCIGFGNKAWVDVTIDNVADGASVFTFPMTRPQLLVCRDDERNVCDQLPIHVMTGGLADPSEKDGLRVRVTATVRNEAGERGSASIEAVLRQHYPDDASISF